MQESGYVHYLQGHCPCCLRVAGTYQHNADRPNCMLYGILMDTVVEIQVPKRHQTAARQAVVRCANGPGFDPRQGDCLYQRYPRASAGKPGSYDLGAGSPMPPWSRSFDVG